VTSLTSLPAVPAAAAWRSKLALTSDTGLLIWLTTIASFEALTHVAGKTVQKQIDIDKITIYKTEQ